jgi:hypothetical protein
MARQPNNGISAMTAAQRKRQQRERGMERLATMDGGEWTESECLMALTMPQFRGKWQELDALVRLAELRGYKVTVTD